ncbi:MAG: CDP-diacylglycerol--glycerol-3-phosphate 3-phosphatidyltransferase [Oscillospiraceae bacterium]|jgi:CDP-diacylglycerol--glycerol-3-phosphate 3-phosphatidyltransferase|nr:CDP-diacylglycerol--glycerol-3-phosphate 3-phosphatidyltransferase [Oscillospiraceae bacterium]
MNLPNKLTVLRVLMIPLFAWLFFADGIAWNYLWALIAFALASLTDLLDGKIARAKGYVTDFGKLMDPLADKLLVMTALVCFIPGGLVHAVPVIIILAREFVVTSIRLLAASNGKVIAADILGKIKTVLQMVWICYGLFVKWLPTAFAVPDHVLLSIFMTVNHIFVAIVTLVTILSGLGYVKNNRALFRDM